VATFPDLLADRAAAAIAQTRRLVNTAHQRLNTIGSQVASLTPGSWEPLTLEAGWSNVSGYIPAQVRILQNGIATLVGHIQGGTTTNGTTIATLASGYYNPVHAHSFTANVLAGASAVSVAGTISGSTDSNSLTDPTITNNSGIVNTGLGFSAGSNDHAHFPGTLTVNGPSHSHTNLSAGQASATPVNYNTVILSLSTSGVLTIQNCSSSATQLSFNENLPLVTS
jgi:hypothetical protein